MTHIKFNMAVCLALVVLLAIPPAYAKADFENIMLRRTGSGDLGCNSSGK